MTTIAIALALAISIAIAVLFIKSRDQFISQVPTDLKARYAQLRQNPRQMRIVTDFLSKLSNSDGKYYLNRSLVGCSAAVADAAPMPIAAAVAPVAAPVVAAAVTEESPNEFTIIAKSRGAGAGHRFAGFYKKNNNQQEVQINIPLHTDGKPGIRRGYNVLVLNIDGSYNNFINFDTHLDYYNTTDMINFIKDIPEGKIVCAAIQDSGTGHAGPYVKLYENDSYNTSGYVIERLLNLNGNNTPIHMNNGLGNDTISSFKLIGPVKLLTDTHGGAKKNYHIFDTSQSYLAAGGGTYNNTISYAELQKRNPNDVVTTNEVLRLIGGSSTSIPTERDGHAIVGIKGGDEGTASEKIIRANIIEGISKYTTSAYTIAQKTFTIQPNNTPPVAAPAAPVAEVVAPTAAWGDCTNNSQCIAGHTCRKCGYSGQSNQGRCLTQAQCEWADHIDIGKVNTRATGVTLEEHDLSGDFFYGKPLRCKGYCDNNSNCKAWHLRDTKCYLKSTNSLVDDIGSISDSKCKHTLYANDERCYCNKNGVNISGYSDSTWALKNNFKGNDSACKTLCDNACVG